MMNAFTEISKSFTAQTRLAKKRLLLLVLLFAITSARCIHLSLGDVNPLKATDVQFEKPKAPFTAFKDEKTDRTWQSQKTGNVIALYSNCSDKADKPLSMAFAELLKSFDQVETQAHTSVFYDGREAMEAKISGRIDGIKVSLEAILFNKNKCFYQISYSGVTSQFEKEHQYFLRFKETLKAP